MIKENTTLKSNVIQLRNCAPKEHRVYSKQKERESGNRLRRSPVFYEGCNLGDMKSFVMAGTFSQIYLQFVFAVQGRQSLIAKEHKEELHKYITALVQARKAKMLAVHCMPDHAHLFVGIKPVVYIPDFVKEVKVESHEFIEAKGWVSGAFHWQEGYGVFSYGHSQLDRVCKYVLNQEAHHRKKTFREEYHELLEKFAISYEERVLFDCIE